LEKIPLQLAATPEVRPVFVVAFFEAVADSTTFMVTMSPTFRAFRSEKRFVDLFADHRDPSAFAGG
jgi:hypothetical protein